MTRDFRKVYGHRSVSSDIVEGVSWGLLAAAIVSAILYIILA